MNGFSPQRIVVPTDFSDESSLALRTALSLASDPSQVHLLHVLPEMSSADPGVIWGEVNDTSRIQHATEALEKDLQERGLAGVLATVRIGDAGHEIAEYAEQIGADLIIVPSHGRTGIRRLLIGSVAERVVRLAECPVLVLRGKKK